MFTLLTSHVLYDFIQHAWLHHIIMKLNLYSYAHIKNIDNSFVMNILCNRVRHFCV